MNKPKIVVLTGAGISAESGIQTFRGAGGLWNGVSVKEVATPEGWQKNPAMVLEFYNQRRKDAANVQPNAAHTALARLEEKFEVNIITQNVDDLHERGGSTKVMHLHGLLKEVRSSKDPSLIYDIGDKAIKMGDLCKLGSQLRPNVVWFGEAVPMIESAALLCYDAELFVVIGTSMEVYPAASLVHYVDKKVPVYIIDPNIPNVGNIPNLTSIAEKATVGVSALVDNLLAHGIEFTNKA